ncbi:hypothetical protein [Actinacidiphila bryophytorum]|nr:hypothetical protein [Actinacidiphila bryophytorum]MBM9440271.1 hypothetical protein [Actinacidiphila bryophytorum]MBN6547676.1 hypothetical protein [Actinacidiphila bryophytorum]
MRRAALALTGAVLAGGLAIVTSVPASAATGQRTTAATSSSTRAGTASPAATSCPTEGQRFKYPDYATVYLVGPNHVVYYFPDASDYSGLWSSYSGIVTYSASVLNSCLTGQVHPMYAPDLVKVTGNPAVYIWDSYFGYYRWITSQSVFDKYGFSSSKIKTYDLVYPVGTSNYWD